MEIDKELYKEIKAYCDLNGLKPKDFVHKLLKKAFMEEKYGTAPFKVAKPIVVTDAIEKANEEFKEMLKDAGGQEKFEKIVTDLIFHDEENDDVTEKQEEKVETEKKVTKRKIQSK